MGLMGYPSRRALGPRRLLALFLAVLLSAASAGEPAPGGAGVSRLRALLAAGATAGQLRALAREMTAAAPLASRPAVAAWFAEKIERPLAKFPDAAKPNTTYLKRVGESLPSLEPLLAAAPSQETAATANAATAKTAHSCGCYVARLLASALPARLPGALDGRVPPVVPVGSARAAADPDAAVTWRPEADRASSPRRATRPQARPGRMRWRSSTACAGARRRRSPPSPTEALPGRRTRRTRAGPRSRPSRGCSIRSRPALPHRPPRRPRRPRRWPRPWRPESPASSC